MKKRSQTRKFSISEIENLFINKFLEKYQLTERDIQRAFKKYDMDGSGKLSLHELGNIFKLYLNGVDEDDVRDLVNHYDMNGDGEIQLSEFSKLLLSRNSNNKDDWMTIDNMTSKREGQIEKNRTESYFNRNYETISELSSHNDDINTLEYKSKIFLKNMKQLLEMRALDLRAKGKISLTERRAYHTSQLAEAKGREVVMKCFKTFNNGRIPQTVDYALFSKVILKFVPQGIEQPSDELMKYIYSCCIDGESNQANPNLLLDIIFDKEKERTNQFGFRIEPAQPATHTGRPKQGHGPIERSAVNLTGYEINTIPHQYLIRHCRSALPVPANFSMKLLQRSCEEPRYSVYRDHIYGLNINLYSGSKIHLLSNLNPQVGPKVLLYAAAAVVIVHDATTSDQYFYDGHNDDITCVAVSSDGHMAASGQVGRSPEVLIWDLYSYQQARTHKPILRLGKGFFARGVCAIEFSYDNNFLACVGCDDKHTLGIFSLATQRLVTSMNAANGIPPQIRHMIWLPGMQDTSYISDTLSRGDLICTVGERHLKFWCFDRSCVDGINISELLAYRLPRSGKGKISTPKTYTCVACVNTSSGRSFDSGESNKSSQEGVLCFDIVTGGNNGWLYLWRRGVCARASPIAPDPDQDSPNKNDNDDDDGGRSIDSLALQYRGNSEPIIICGCSGGCVRGVLASTFEIIFSYSVLNPVQATVKKLNPTFVSGAHRLGFGDPPQRPASTGRVRPKKAHKPPPGSLPAGISTSKDDSVEPVRRKAPGTLAPQVKNAWKATRSDSKKEHIEGIDGTTKVVGLALQFNAGLNLGLGSELNSIIAVTGFGKVVEILLRNRDATGDNGNTNIVPLFYFHYGCVWALCGDDRARRAEAYSNTYRDQGILGGTDLFITGGDDKWLSVWRCTDHSLVCRASTTAPILCCDLYSYIYYPSVNDTTQIGLQYKSANSVILNEGLVAVGLTKGVVNIFLLTIFRRGSRPGLANSLSLLTKHRDCQRDISEIKFSPNGKMLAVGSHDNAIDIYYVKYTSSSDSNNCNNNDSLVMKLVKRLRGHSSYITHLDWSHDNRIIRSNCGSYELLFWDIGTGKLLMSALDSHSANISWHTNTCVLDFSVMAIWPKDSDGTDINSVDVNDNMHIVVTGDDFGHVNVFNYPCVAKDAPGLVLSGHSSHVPNVRFLEVQKRMTDDHYDNQNEISNVISVGGKDCSAMLWKFYRK